MSKAVIRDLIVASTTLPRAEQRLLSLPSEVGQKSLGKQKLKTMWEYSGRQMTPAWYEVVCHQSKDGTARCVGTQNLLNYRIYRGGPLAQLAEHLTFNQGVLGSSPRRLTLNNKGSVNDFVNKILAMAQTQGNQEITEFLSIGGLQLGTPIANQKWIDEFLASRRQGLSERTLEFYRDMLYQAEGIELTPKGINNWLTNLNCGNAKFSYYRAMKAFCNWLYKSKKINKNPITLVDRPKVSKRLLSAITKEQLATLIRSVNYLRDACILRLLFDSGCRLSEIAGIKDTDFIWDKGNVTVIGKGNKQREAPYTDATGEMLKQWFSEHKTFELNRGGVQTMLKRLEQKTGITCNAHCFRRGFAIELLKQGKSTRIVQKMGGWESIAMVEKYSEQLSQDDALKQYSR